MKKIFLYLCMIMIAFLFFTACKKMDAPYKKFLVPGGLTYPERANNAVAYAGRNRVKIAWPRGSDPSVAKARIYWNNYTDSVEIDISHSSEDTISAVIDDLQEGSYNFFIKTYDDKGNVSVPVEVIASAYGDNYQASLLSTPVYSDVILNVLKDSIAIQWGPSDISGGAFAKEIRYKDTLGQTKIKRFPISQEVSGITGITKSADTDFYYRTLYIPDTLSIDTFYTDFEPYNKPYLFDKSAWKVIDFSTEYPGREDTKVQRIIDGDTTTRWHSNKGHSKRADFVTVDMKAERTITYFELWRDNGDDRACDSFQLFVSKDNVTWDSLGGFHFDRFTDVGQTYEIPSHPTARYWKFVGLPGPENYQVMGEISVYGF